MKVATSRARTGPRNPPARDWLKTAAKWRILSLFFQIPTRRSRRELKGLLTKAPRELSGLAREWIAIPIHSAEAEFHRVLGPGGVPAIESSYDPNALAGRGPLLADVRGFYEAFSYLPKEPPAELPDHIAVELDFLSYLAFKIAFACYRGVAEETEIASQAYERFQAEHLSTWLVPFQDRLVQSSSLFHSRAAAAVITRSRNFSSSKVV